jgi:thioredoxin-related protein
MLYRLALLFLLACLSWPSWSDTRESAPDWQEVGAEAEARGLPVVILVTDHDCGFCERMRREFLTTEETRALLGQGAVTKELPRDSVGKLTDFDGERVRTRVFLSRYEVFATPTLLFLSPSGETLAPALVGYSGSGDYPQMVSKRLASATEALGSGDRMAHAALADHER